MSGIRDEALLESALDRANNVLAYNESATSIFNIATTYAKSISKNHPFLDGNKRTGFALCFCFLITHDYKLLASNDDVVKYMVGIASDTISEKDFQKWLEENSEPFAYTFEDKALAADILINRYDKALAGLFNQ